MGNTIGSSPRPATTSSASRTSASAASTAAPAPAASQPRDSFSPVAGSTGLGEAIRTDKSPESITAMSHEELKGISGEEVKGMNRGQFKAFEEAIDKGPGREGLDPKVKSAMFRKSFMQNLLEDCNRYATQHNQSKW